MASALAFISIVVIPACFTLLNIISAFYFFIKKKEKAGIKYFELAGIAIGMFYMCTWVWIRDIRIVSWDTQLYGTAVHSMIAPETLPTVLTVFAAALICWGMIRFVPAGRQPPLVSAVGIAGIYLGAALCAVWCIQTAEDWVLIIYPANCILLFVKTVYIFICDKSELIRSGQVSLKYKKLPEFMNKAENLPWIALLIAVPLLGVIIAVLFLFGQQPDSIIKAWTETAEWTLSQKIAPQNIAIDEHYLCTVAAGGHRKVVKPLRTGKRHGHKVVVNRQLCIANAFEQVLEEKTPKFHKAVRTFYDKSGYPIAKHIHSPYLADVIYIVMKPLEWLFLLVLYAVDVKPENRISVQYPHAPLPK